jgi:1-acyl-sn-glycerol-3-phosphate acyltransferase
MSASEQEMRCIATTRAGSQCKSQATAGSEYCHIHRPVTIGVPEAGSPSGETPANAPAGRYASDETLRKQLLAELDALVKRIKALTPNYEPPKLGPSQMIEVINEQTSSLAPKFASGILERVRKTIKKDLLDVETWKGMWYMVNYTLEYQGDILRRRLKGEYETDEWGLDWEYLEAVRPFLDFMYKLYWRVSCSGIENIPDYDRALLVSNHSGQIPWDSVMIMTAILNEHPAQRLVRNLYDESTATLPFLSASLTRVGQAVDSVENGIRLLAQDELVGVYPEGQQGPTKLFKDRYKLARFDRSDFVKMALASEAPIIPVSVVGAEETTITLARTPAVARLGIRSLPITPRFPWLGLLGAIPWPTRWYIDFGEPFSLDSFGPDAAEDAAIVSQLTDQVRNVVQDMVNRRLALRHSVIG